MEPKQVWMSRDTRKKSHYGYRSVGRILGIVLLMMLLLFAGSYLRAALGIGPHGLSLLWLSGVFLLGVGLTVRLSHRAVQDATFFFLTENDGL